MKLIEAYQVKLNNDSGGTDEIFGQNTEPPESLIDESEYTIELTGEELLELLAVDEETFNQDSIQTDGHWLVFAKGRNTSTVVTASSRDEAISKFRKTSAAGHDAPIVSARQATSEEETAISKKVWIRSRSNGDKTSGSGSYHYRPHLAKKAKGNSFSV